MLTVSVNEIERLIRDRHRSPDAVRFEPVQAESLEPYRLEPDEREAVLAKDYGWLYRHGVHPMAVLFLSQDNREPMASYLAAIGAADERVGQLGSLFAKATPTDQSTPSSAR